MKSGNREVNIFNLSMLDVICGALGAVLIIMISLSTRPSEATPPCPECPQCLPEGENCDEYRKRIKQLENRRPASFYIHWYEDEDLDIYIEDFTGKMKPPAVAKQSPVWPGDVALDRKGTPGYEIWMNRDMPQGGYKMYAKLVETNPAKLRTTKVVAGILYANELIQPGWGTITPENRILFFGTLHIDAGGKASFSIAPGITRFN